MQRAEERAKALQGHVQMPPAMITSLDKLVSSALAARRAAMPAPESLQSSVQAALSLTLPETGEISLFLQLPNRGNVEAWEEEFDTVSILDSCQTGRKCTGHRSAASLHCRVRGATGVSHRVQARVRRRCMMRTAQRSKTSPPARLTAPQRARTCTSWRRRPTRYRSASSLVHAGLHHIDLHHGSTWFLL